MDIMELGAIGEFVSGADCRSLGSLTMDLAQLADLGEFIGGVAVLVTLVPDLRSDTIPAGGGNSVDLSLQARPEGE